MVFSIYVDLVITTDQASKFYFCYTIDSSKNKAIPLFCCGVRIGQIKPSILDHLLVYDDVLTAEIVNGKVASVRLSDNLSDAGKRTMAVNGMLKDLQSKDLFPRLNGWRNEVCMYCTVC